MSCLPIFFQYESSNCERQILEKWENHFIGDFTECLNWWCTRLLCNDVVCTSVSVLTSAVRMTSAPGSGGVSKVYCQAPEPVYIQTTHKPAQGEYS